eukprot:1158515-Pelagomonas_calceolata.AAC.3
MSPVLLLLSTGDESVRWRSTADELGEKMLLLVGDVFLSAACISYTGAFTGGQCVRAHAPKPEGPHEKLGLYLSLICFPCACPQDQTTRPSAAPGSARVFLLVLLMCSCMLLLSSLAVCDLAPRPLPQCPHQQLGPQLCREGHPSLQELLLASHTLFLCRAWFSESVRCKPVSWREFVLTYCKSRTQAAVLPIVLHARMEVCSVRVCTTPMLSELAKTSAHHEWKK